MSKLNIVPPSKGPAVEGDFVYFAYGSSLDFDAFTRWCGEHGYQLPDLSKAEPAVLPDFALVFNVRSRFWGGGTASIEPRPGAKVEGLALPMPAVARGLIRHKEGMNSGLYQERAVRVRTKSGAEVDAVAYEASPDRTDPSATPSAAFVQTLVKGAEARGLSAEWVAQLKKL